MKISVHAVSVDLLANSLANLSHVLEKGHAHAVAREVRPCPAPRRAPHARHAAVDPPDSDRIGREQIRRARVSPASKRPKFEDKEQTFEELQARIARTIDFIKGVPASALEGSEDRTIKVPVRDGALEFKGSTT